MAFSATGGTVTTDGAYTVHKFVLADSGTSLVCTGDPSLATVLVVGGAAGGSSGGGGAGGYLTGTEILTGSMVVTVGDGGVGGTVSGGIASRGGTGADSVFGTRTAKGGGGGGFGEDRAGAVGADGGSGGGGGASGTVQHAGGAATGSPSSQGNAGGNNAYIGSPYPSGGGGGAGAAGQSGQSNSVAGNGGAGINSDVVLRGTNVGYAGGGGGSTNADGTPGTATHGGGNGNDDAGVGEDGVDGTGGGGGGAGNFMLGGTGGSGSVVVRYLTGGETPPTDLAAIGTIELAGSASIVGLNFAFLEAIGTIGLGEEYADLTPWEPMVAVGSISLDGAAWLTAVIHGDDTMQAIGTITLSGTARRLSTGEVLPPTDDLGWTAPDVTTPDLRGLLVTVGGLSVKRAQITDLVIELDTEGGPKSATLSVNCALTRAPRLMQSLVVTYKGQTLFRGRLENISGNVDSSTGYTLTYAGPLVTLRDHKAYRAVYVDSDLQNWSTDQGPRTSPDTFEVASRSSGATV